MTMLEFSWFPDPVVIANELRRVAGNLESLEEPLLESADPIGRSFQRKIANQGDGEWPAWSDNYLPYAIAHNVGMLWQDGDLIEGLPDEGNFIVTGGELIFDGETLPPYWIWHQEGIDMRAKGGRLPARPFIEIDDEGRAEVIAVFEEWMEANSQWSVTASGQLRNPKGQFTSLRLF